MALLDAQTSNAVTELITESAELEQVLDRLWSITARFNLNGIYAKVATTQNLIDSGFPHMTQSKVGNIVEAIKAVQVALGAGNQATPVRDDLNGKAGYLLQAKG